MKVRSLRLRKTKRSYADGFKQEREEGIQIVDVIVVFEIFDRLKKLSNKVLLVKEKNNRLIDTPQCYLDHVQTPFFGKRELKAQKKNKGEVTLA